MPAFVGAKSLCTAFLACISANGVNPDYVHRLQVDTRIEVQYYGTLTEDTLNTLKYCSVVVAAPVTCDYHPEPEE
jgi:hypothetical protein